MAVVLAQADGGASSICYASRRGIVRDHAAMGGWYRVGIADRQFWLGDARGDLVAVL